MTATVAADATAACAVAFAVAPADLASTFVPKVAGSEVCHKLARRQFCWG